MLLVHAPPSLCHRLLRPGESKRIMPAGPLVGYYLCCPACKRLGIYLSADGGWVESGWTKSEWCGVLREEDDAEQVVMVWHPATVSHDGLVCYGCAGRVVVRENEISVTG